jgi:hypothetical protein
MGIVYAGGDTWKVSASDLTFLFDECRRCFWLKLVGGLPRPRAPFPKVFSLLDAQTKRFFERKRTQQISGLLPPGRVIQGERAVRSTLLALPGHRRPLLIGGRFDTALRFDDGTFGILDFKTTTPRTDHIDLYGRQLHAYALAAENSAPGALHLQPVTRLGLLCVEPTAMVRHRGGVAYRGEPHWVEVPRVDRDFLRFLREVLSLLERPTPPLPSPNCAFCDYLTTGALTLVANNVMGTN